MDNNNVVAQVSTKTVKAECGMKRGMEYGMYMCLPCHKTANYVTMPLINVPT